MIVKKNLGVAVIEPVGGHGGANYYDFGLCDGIATTGVDVVLHTCDETQGKGVTFEVRRDFRHIYGKAAAWRRGLRYGVGLLRALVSAVREGRQVCHFHFYHVGVLQIAELTLARLLRRRVVVTAHDVESFVDALEVPRLSRWAYAMAHRIIAHNQTSRAELIARLGVEPSRIRVIPHGSYIGLTPSLPPQSVARAKLELDACSYVVLFFGQIKQVKGLDVLLQAVAKLAPVYPSLRLLIAGRPWHTQFAEYQSLINKLEIESRCNLYVRYIDDNEAAFFFSAADLVVLPYRRIYQSGVLLMAMSYAKPVIVSDLPGMTEVVEHGRTGMIFRTGDADNLAERIRVAIDDPERCALMAEAGYRYVREYHDWRLIGQSTCLVYRDLVSCVTD